MTSPPPPGPQTPQFIPFRKSFDAKGKLVDLPRDAAAAANGPAASGGAAMSTS